MDRTKRTAARSKSDKFAALKAARQGQARSQQWKDDNAEDLYDEVDEGQYKQIVRGRLQQDDFIEDDDGGGYADNGMDVWEDEVIDAHMDEDSEGDRRAKKKRLSKSTLNAEPRKYGAAPAAKSTSTSITSAYRKPVAPEQEEDFMRDLLAGVTESKTVKRQPPHRPQPRKRKSSPVHETSSDGESSYLIAGPAFTRPNGKGRPLKSEDETSDPLDDTSPIRPVKRAKVDVEFENKAVGHVSRLKMEDTSNDLFPVGAEDFDSAMFDDDFDLELEETKPTTKPSYVPKASVPVRKEANPSWLALHSTLMNASVESEEALATSNSVSVGTNVNAIQNDGTLQMYWLDYAEVHGKLYLIGKVLDKGPDNKGKKYISACITVQGLERNLFVVPREKALDGGHPTDVIPTRKAVQDDFNQMRREARIARTSSKWVKRSYAFGAEGIPEGESDWLKVVYGFDEEPLPTGLQSDNIAGIFGAQTSAFELFVLKRKIMGPCWLRIEQPEVVDVSKMISWCKAEFIISDPKHIKLFPDTDNNAPRETPPLCVMSMAIRSIVNHDLNKREIVTASARIWENNRIDDPTPPEKQPSVSHTIVRPLGKYPPGFEVKAKAEKRSKVVPAVNERVLLGQVLALLLKYDPDVIVGHEFIGDHLEILLQRLKELKMEHWSRIGRLRRNGSLSLGKQGTNVRWLTGRLVCDLTSDAAKGMIASTTWSLTEMCNTQLKHNREEIDPEDTHEYFDSTLSGPDRMLRFVQHCEMDTFFQMALAAKVQILPLTRQLTNLAGNSWGKTLTGGRSERNEYILLHEFHRLKYVCPDKYGNKRDAAATAQAEAEELDPEGGVITSKKGKAKSKEKYKGGLVFEPKRGLWDKYVLVMDFNSLYPSIIQEYNIDFTTVDRVENEDDIPEVPSDHTPGVLPRLIATLVNRRKQVKGFMKDRNATPAQLLQWNIKQQALKLTANSMYGCLGFSGSRFYARPLAALTTHKGREILTHTRELAESMNLDVVYGDTDSVFVNSNVTDLAEALKTANQFKKLVNERYKLLEIDLDGIFQRLLLLQKKKYAAMKVDDGGTTSMEIKGLDMKRREFSPLAKNVSEYVLKQILSGAATEEAVEVIHAYLMSIGDDIRAGKIPFEDFIINKRLGKDPERYPDAKSQPHVQVGLRLKARGKSARAGDIIPYIFCLGPGGESSKSAQADRAHHPDEIRRSNGELKIDYEYYLAAQVLPAITRLCEPIEGTDRPRLAECLGLNSDQYAIAVAGVPQERRLGVLDSQMPDSERFKDCKPLDLRCPKCSSMSTFSRISDEDQNILTLEGACCPSCSEKISPASIELQLNLEVHHHIARYYEGWLICDDPTCGTRTRRMSVIPRKCLRQGCYGSVSSEYTDTMLYDQLLMFASLFDMDKAAAVAGKSASRKADVEQLLVVNHVLLSQLSEAVALHLERCGRRWVDLTDLFSFMQF